MTHNLTENILVSNAPRDKLSRLRPEVEHQDNFILAGIQRRVGNVLAAFLSGHVKISSVSEVRF